MKIVFHNIIYDLHKTTVDYTYHTCYTNIGKFCRKNQVYSTHEQGKFSHKQEEDHDIQILHQELKNIMSTLRH